jgi:hypothetical protein
MPLSRRAIRRGDGNRFFRLGRIRGVDRPPWLQSFPTATGSCVVLDIGANPDCKPENLLQFAIMGSVYAEKVRGVQEPQRWDCSPMAKKKAKATRWCAPPRR